MNEQPASLESIQKSITSLRRLGFVTVALCAANLIALLFRKEQEQHIQTGSQSVTVGAAGVEPAESTAHQDYFTTEQVAARHDVSVRTIQDWCQNAAIGNTAEKRLIGAELRGKSYVIAADYRILPPNAALAQE